MHAPQRERSANQVIEDAQLEHDRAWDEPDDIKRIHLACPMTFEDIFKLWVGEEKYNQMLLYEPHQIGIDFDYEYLRLIRQVEEILTDEIKNMSIHLYMKSPIGAGRDLFSEFDRLDILFADTREGYGSEGIHKYFKFMRHYYLDGLGTKSEPLYFDGEEMIRHFPFLDKQQKSVSPEGETEIHASLWQMEATKRKGASAKLAY